MNRSRKGGKSNNREKKKSNPNYDCCAMSSRSEEVEGEKEEPTAIDESFYSRQLIEFGEAAMQKMASSKVFLSGLSPLGVEVAKNVALAGVSLLALNESGRVVSASDLSANFYAEPCDVGKSCVEVARPRLAELNPYTRLCTASLDLSKESDLATLVASHSCVILVDEPWSVQCRVNEYCHEHNVAFLSGSAHGLFGSAFADFGQSFRIFDADGLPPSEFLIGNVTNEAEALLSTLAEATGRHLVAVGDWLTLDELGGDMAALNGRTAEVLEVLDASTVRVNADTSAMAPFEAGRGWARQRKRPVERSYVPLAEAVGRADLVALFDYTKMDVLQLHLAWHALCVRADERAGDPSGGADAAAHAKRVVELAAELNAARDVGARLGSIDVELIESLAAIASGTFAPLVGLIGGTLAQECIKAVSGKYTPLNQFFHYDFRELANVGGNKCTDDDDEQSSSSSPSSSLSLSSSESPVSNRYDGQSMCIGRELSERLRSMRVFMVGSGAIGCELLKYMAVMGVATADDGEVAVTDDDTIERSNLNRQFLFRPADINKSKSECAARSARAINSAIRVRPLKLRLCPDTEDTFDFRFFESRDVCFAALDNLKARMYLDERCVATQRAMLDSGTHGMDGHSQPCVPFKTKRYGRESDPGGDEQAGCTVRNFPFQPVHCLTEDMQVLTNRGFLFRDQVKAAYENDAAFRVAAYCLASGSIVYEKPDGLVDQRKMRRRIVEFTQAAEKCEWDDDGSETPSLVEGGGDDSTGLSLRVTDKHTMYVEMGKRRGDSDRVAWARRLDESGGGKRAKLRDGLVAKQASELLSDDERDVYRFRSIVANGLASANGSRVGDRVPLLRQLGIAPTKAIHLLRLYGFWLGGGFLTFRRVGGGGESVDDAVGFGFDKQEGRAFLLGTCGALGLEGGRDFVTACDNGALRLLITNKRWVHAFFDQYACKYGPCEAAVGYGSAAHPCRRLPADEQPPTYFAAGAESTKWCWHWVWNLCKEEVLWVVEGLAFADGAPLERIFEKIAIADELKGAVDDALGGSDKEAPWKLSTLSPTFCDEICRMALHAGMSPLARVSDEITPRYDITLSRARQPLVDAATDVHMSTRSERVWCLTMPSGTLIARRACRAVVSDDDEKQLQVVTKASRPVVVGNCVQWARIVVFDDDLVAQPLSFNQLVADLADADADRASVLGVLERFYAANMDNLEKHAVPSLVASMLEQRPSSFADCVRCARFAWQEYFANKPSNLLYNFPLDATTSSGAKFWMSPRRPSTPLQYSSDDRVTLDFIVAYANLWAHMWHLEVCRDREHAAQLANAVDVPPFKPRKERYETDEKKVVDDEETPVSDDDDAGASSSSSSSSSTSPRDSRMPEIGVVEKQASRLAAAMERSGGARSLAALLAAAFEKDDDSNFHIDLIASATNLRARNYAIRELSRLDAKRIAGKILPAVATTTSVVSALITAEMVKVVADLPADQFRDVGCNLGLGLWSVFESSAPSEQKMGADVVVTEWHRWDFCCSPETPFGDLVNFVGEQAGADLPLAQIMQGDQIRYMTGRRYRTRLSQPIADIIEFDDDVAWIVAYFDPSDEEVMNAMNAGQEPPDPGSIESPLVRIELKPSV
jgi:molybdopterin/thiamine biosynthesis adenylyltransferase